MSINRWGVGDCGCDCGPPHSSEGCRATEGCDTLVGDDAKTVETDGDTTTTTYTVGYAPTDSTPCPCGDYVPISGACGGSGESLQVAYNYQVVIVSRPGEPDVITYRVNCATNDLVYAMNTPGCPDAATAAAMLPIMTEHCDATNISAIRRGGKLCVTGEIACDSPFSAPTKSMIVCVVTCDGEPLVNAAVTASSDDPSGPFSWPIVDPETDPPLTGEDGCVTVAVPLGLAGDAPISITVTALPEYKATTVATTFDDQAGADPIAADVADHYTCCDLDFRKGPTNPSGAPYTPRGTPLFFITSGGFEGEADVDCDGTGCALSDEIEPTGGAPTVTTCPPGDFSDGPWDHWTPPALTSNRVPMLVRVWYDGTDWHCSATVIGTKARPPLGGCNIDPTQQLADFYGWIRSDASCDENDDPKLSVDPDPTLTYPIGVDPDGGSWYSGSTTPITVEASSYTVNANNPVDITFHFDPVAVPVHGGTANISIVDSITVWQPPPPTP